MELLYDAEIHVKLAALELVFKVIDLYTVETLNEKIAPLFLELV